MYIMNYFDSQVATWSEWSEYEDCSEICGGGIETRRRTCTYPDTTESTDCGSENSMSQNCNTEECPCKYGSLNMCPDVRIIIWEHIVCNASWFER